MRKWILLPWIIAIFYLVLTGCARFAGEPLYLEFPDEPSLSWALCFNAAREPMLCLSQGDGAKLSKWVDKLRAFEHARARLLKK